MSHKTFKLLIVLGVFVVGGVAIYQQIADAQDDLVNHCKATGKQRMVNSMFHGSDSSLTTLVVQDQWICDNGRVKWKTPYNDFN